MPATRTTPRVSGSSRWRSENISHTAAATASTALSAPRRTLLKAHCRKRSQGSTDQSAASGRSMKATGSTNPISTGTAHTDHASTRRPPCSAIGCASFEPARAPRVTAKRMRFCARCSNHSSTATSASKVVASCAAATRLSIASQAL